MEKTMRKTFKVVMLPTKEVSVLTLWNNKELMLSKNSYRFYSKECAYQQLYVLSDDEIKEGDWQINHLTNKVSKRTKSALEVSQVNCSKIVATTDILHGEFLQYSGERYKIPQLPESFIQKYIKAYNEGNPITEVDLAILFSSYGTNKEELEKNKTTVLQTTKDNSVICLYKKDKSGKKYTEEEVIEFLTDFGVYLGKKASDSESYLRTYREVMEGSASDWFKEKNK